MRKPVISIGMMIAVLASLTFPSCSLAPAPTASITQNPYQSTLSAKASNGYDQFGYNNTARIFNGIADGIDRVLDGTDWGDVVYANDKVVMKWNAEWDRGNNENWSKPPYDAWTSNEWNGANGGSGDVWHYKIIWVGTAEENSTYWRTGGYAIWGQFEVIMDQGSSANEHFWIAHGKSTGYHVFP